MDAKVHKINFQSIYTEEVKFRAIGKFHGKTRFLDILGSQILDT